MNFNFGCKCMTIIFFRFVAHEHNFSHAFSGQLTNDLIDGELTFSSLIPNHTELLTAINARR